jgi:hypothetical protein
MATASKAGSKPAKEKQPAKAEKPEKKAARPASKTAAKPASKAAVVPAKSKATQSKKTALTAEQRRYYVEVAAYYIAERRGFTGGSEMADWVQAEAEIDRLLQEGILKP